uniref:Uncharacterized protein n=1 Tax=Anguilla anguilla TaxID=7936 RepID=A0A0E9VG40_ANGAN
MWQCSSRWNSDCLVLTNWGLSVQAHSCFNVTTDLAQGMMMSQTWLTLCFCDTTTR